MLNSINIKDYKIDDSFFTPYQDLIRKVVIPYQRAVFENAIPGIEKSSVIDNFKICAGEMEGDFYGMVFQDSDLAKWLEAAAYSLAISPDEALEKDCDELIALIGRCQKEDGYLNTFFSVKYPERRWENLHECHELYCAGHMMEAAVAYYNATGKDSLLKIMCRNADHIASIFGKEEGKHRGFPGHPEIELALMRMYHTTGNETYKELCRYFIDERGTRPNFFAEETKRRGWVHFKMDPEDTLYAQNNAPVREQTVAVGHAVRAVYLYTGMAMLASETKDSSLLSACETLFVNITTKQMYLTGGIGSTRFGEAFTVDYDLPNDTIYSETCASVGLIFFSKAMLNHRIHNKYSDTMELALYNCVLAGMQMDGKRFFYVNPLEVNPGISGVQEVFSHVLPERPGWFGCACCPPNVARLLTSLGQYVWSYDEEYIYNHLYIGGAAEIDGCGILLKTNYPTEGTVTYLVEHTITDKKLAIRIPGWCDNYSIEKNGMPVKYEVSDGYAYLTEPLTEGDEITFIMELKAEKIYASTSIRSDAGNVAIKRGPVVYCFEGIDQPALLQKLRVKVDGAVRENTRESLFSDVVDENIHKTMSATAAESRILSGDILSLSVDGYLMSDDGTLYSKKRPEKTPVTLKAIPYYAWSNRGLTQMRVWMVEEV